MARFNREIGLFAAFSGRLPTDFKDWSLGDNDG
jgi:hypothetical protein